MESRPFWEATLRRWLALPKHNSANDDARILAQLALASLAASIASCALLSAHAAWGVWAGACTLTGIALQQYAWYSAYTAVDCLSDELPSVLLIAFLASVLLAFMGTVLALVLQATARPFALCALCMLVLTVPRMCVRWMGSLYDGTDKLAQYRR
uniref:Uncharacterized protein n=1 Tax=Coccolithus braarudii TaxID=221442 RepID=A0A7S0LJ62_9EUKA